MSRNPLSSSPLPLAVAALLTFGFVGCVSETQSLNTIEAGNGGEEGETPDAGSGGRAAGGPGQAGHAGLYQGETGGGPPAAGSAGYSPGGSSYGGFGGDGYYAGAPQGGAGSPNGGVPNAGSGAFAGFAGTAGGSIAGGAGAPTCDSSDGTGCDGHGFCVDEPLDICIPDNQEHCTGTCAVPALAPTCYGLGGNVQCPQDFECLPEPNSLLGTDPYGLCIGGKAPDCEQTEDCAEGFSCVPVGDARRCVPNRAHCTNYGMCSSVQAPKCPIGYAVADAQGCDYVCVPYEQCGCETAADCVAPSLCDRVSGRCFAPRAAAPRCLEPYDPGPCDANFSVYAFVDGECQAVQYGGCEGNDNRFATRAECLSACQGMPLEQECPEGSVAAQGCLACGAGGGCPTYGNYCFTQCESSDDCTEAGFSCVDGICQVVGCV